MSSPSQPPSDMEQKEDFQRYLERSGVIDALTKVLVGLYQSPDKPGNAIEFVKEFLGNQSAGQSNAEVDELKKKLSEKDAEISALKKQIEELQQSQQSAKPTDTETENGAAPMTQ